MKQKLLEAIIRQCVKEMLEIVPVIGGLEEAENPPGALAPPAGGQGTADAPALPDTTQMLSAQAARGLFFVNPKAPQGKPLKLDVKMTQDADLERQLYRVAAKTVGPTVQVAANTIRSVKNQLAGSAPTVFLYIGRQNTDDPHLTLLAAKDRQEAIQGTVAAGDVSADYGTYQATPQAPDTQMPQAGPEFATKTKAPEIDERKELRKMVSSMVKEELRKARKKK